MMSKLSVSLLSAMLIGSIMMLPSVAQAYPGMQKQAQGEVQSSIDLINVLPKPYPIDVVPFKDGAGNSVDFSQYRGQVIMVNMWATWCPPCVRELPALDRFAKKFDQQDFAVLPISIDLDGTEQVKPFLEKLGMPEFNTYYDKTQQLGQVFPLDTIPATFILNGKGELVAFVRTFVDWDDEKAVSLINSFIEQEQLATKSAAE
ncbi:TlpA disulfide reductase family protein [Shewanella waksmanii]|uniref:TlpA disulfide reductase family protein n=1 Tax=Shewanella waksmanii TaxID=213783 RepID=UPI003734EBAD